MKKNIDRVVALALTALALVVYLSLMANYAYPGEGARLMVLWRELDFSALNLHPLMKAAAALFGFGNLLAPVCGAVSVGLVYWIFTHFLQRRMQSEEVKDIAELVIRFGGVVSALVFMLTPAVISASTHLESALFGAMLIMVVVALLMFHVEMRQSFCGRAAAYVAAILLGMTAVEAPVIVFFLPLAIVALYKGNKYRKRSQVHAFVWFFLIVILAYILTAKLGVGEVVGVLRLSASSIKSLWSRDGWMCIFAFATIPFFATVASARVAFSRQQDWMMLSYHLAMTLVAILAIATPLSASSVMEPWAVCPVIASAFAAFVGGYVTAYWLTLACLQRKASRFKYILGRVMMIMSLLVFGIAAVVGFIAFDHDKGRFADIVAERIIADLGERQWLVSDGSLDDHLRLAANRQGVDLKLVCLNRDLDTQYLERLAKVVADEQLIGERTDELALSLSLGVLPFVQDWFAADPKIADKAVVYGAPDLWYSAKLSPVPEFFFFGANPQRPCDWERQWMEFDKLLATPETPWGSYRISKVRNPIDRMRLNLRRHLGMVANNRGVWLQDQAKDDEAFNLYNLVLNEIDRDNVCALFNEFELARHGRTRAKDMRNELERRFKAILEDADRRYRLWSLGNYYGYIRSPEVFVNMGMFWARSGRPGAAIAQINRAIELVPTDRRTSMMNMLASLYASEEDATKSRDTYRSVLASDEHNHDALIGMMRIEIMDGDIDEAIEYLRKATESVSEKDPRYLLEKAMLHLMRNEVVQARELLKRLVGENANNLQAWSLYAAATIQACDAEKNLERRQALTKELEESILPKMEKMADNPANYYVQSTRAFVLMRKGEDSRKAARDAFIAASRARPSNASTQDIILGLDISLNDVVHAERQAREMLRRNRKAPLANYVMGSLALRKGEYAEAEAFLRRSVDTKRPGAMALNDLSEVLRRNGRLPEAEKFARKAVEVAPNLYVAWETLGSIILDASGNLEEAEACIKKACNLSKDANGRPIDIRMLVSLARVQIARGDILRGKGTLRQVQPRMEELSNFEREEYEALRKRASAK